MEDFPVGLIVIYFAAIFVMIAAMWKVYEKPGSRDGHVSYPFTIFTSCSR